MGLAALSQGARQGTYKFMARLLRPTFGEEITAHHGAMVKLRVSHDGRFVFSAGEDGVIFIYHVIEPRDLMPQMERIEMDTRDREDTQARIVDDQLADIVLIPKGTLEQFKVTKENIR